MKTKKWIGYFVQIWAVLSLFILITGCAGNRVVTKPFSADKILHYSQLKNLNEDANPNNYIVYLNKGDIIPLKISMDTDFMDFKQDQVDVVAKQKLYFRVEVPENLSVDELVELGKLTAQNFSEMSDSQKTAFLKDYRLYISKDGIHWASLFGGKAYRNVLGFKSGQISFAMMASRIEGLGASLDIRTVK